MLGISCIHRIVMKHTLLLLLLISILLVTSSCDQIIKVEIAIPQQLVPYYEWLLYFPGLQTPPEDPHPTETRISIVMD